jgi:ribosomal protein L37AE/L43A
MRTDDERLLCPFCENALLPDRITAERFICTCCSRQFTQAQVLTALRSK